MENKQNKDDITFFSLKEDNKNLRYSKQEKYLEDSKKRLKVIAKTKLTTTFIGAIAAFEKFFGKYLPLNKNPEDMTPNEKLLYETWIECRKTILDNGNLQVKNLLAEIENNTISWNRYTVNLPLKTKE